MSEKLHIHKAARAKHSHHSDEGGKQHIGAKAKDTPGIICIERNIHDEAVVISGTLTIEFEDADLNAWIAGELEKAAQAIKTLDGIVGHIKAAVTLTSTDVISVTDEKAMVTEARLKRARIALAAIVFMIEPKEAENIIRKALAGVRSRLRDEKSEDQQ